MLSESEILLAVFIFLSRVADVSLGTVRVICISRGKKYLAAGIGFVEVLIWILVIGQIMQNLGNVLSYFAFAGGFATGNFVGILIAEKLSLGVVMIRVITMKDAALLVEALRAASYAVTSLDGEGATGPVKIIFTILPRRRATRFIDIVKGLNPHAFYSIEEVSYVTERPYVGCGLGANRASWLNLFRPARKSK